MTDIHLHGLRQTLSLRTSDALTAQLHGCVSWVVWSRGHMIFLACQLCLPDTALKCNSFPKKLPARYSIQKPCLDKQVLPLYHSKNTE